MNLIKYEKLVSSTDRLRGKTDALNPYQKNLMRV